MSKLTIHCQGIPGYIEGFIKSSGVQYIKLIDPPEQDPFPGTRVIGRTYMPDEKSNEMIWRGAAGGEEWFHTWKNFYSSRRYVWAWESPNEPHPMWIKEFRVALDQFLSRWIELMHANGYKTIAGCFSVGWPDVGTARDMGNSLQASDYIGLHEYSAPSMQDDESWHCLRYRRTINELEAAGYKVRPIMITEAGIDGGVVNRPKRGWKTFATEDSYMSQLAWYDSELMKDPIVETATIFVAGPNSDWIDFEVTESLSVKLSRHIVENPTPNPPVNNGIIYGIDVSMFQGDINWDSVKKDGYRFAMIRASGSNGDRSAVIKDTKFDRNYTGAGSAGILRGAYHGLHPSFSGQAALFVNTVGDRVLELGYWSDLEGSELTDDKCAAHVDAVDRNIAQRLGVQQRKFAGIYTSPSFMANKHGAWAVGRKLWVAHWTTSERPIVPSPWADWEFWQYSNRGSVGGIQGNVDLDKYNGSETKFLALYGFVDTQC